MQCSLLRTLRSLQKKKDLFNFVQTIIFQTLLITEPEFGEISKFMWQNWFSRDTIWEMRHVLSGSNFHTHIPNRFYLFGRVTVHLRLPCPFPCSASLRDWTPLSQNARSQLGSDLRRLHPGETEQDLRAFAQPSKLSTRKMNGSFISNIYPLSLHNTYASKPPFLFYQRLPSAPKGSGVGVGSPTARVPGNCIAA